MPWLWLTGIALAAPDCREDPAACVELGREALKAGDRDGAKAWFREACSDASLGSCTPLLETFDEGHDAVKSALQHCQMDNHRRCAQLAHFLWKQAPEAMRDPPKAYRLYLRACRNGVDSAWGIIVQFPFYAGIFGLLQNTGLGKWLGDLFAEVATTTTYPWIVYVYSGVMNLFVPSAGSKWMIEAPFLIPAGDQLDVSVVTVLLAYAYGDSTTNLIQPFFAIPILAVTRLRFGDIVCPTGQGEYARLAAQHSYFGLARPLVDLMQQLLTSGEAGRLRDEAQAVLERRLELTVNALGSYDLSWRPGLAFVWLKLPMGWRASTFMREAETVGVLVRSADEYALMDGSAPNAIRIAIDGRSPEPDFVRALAAMTRLLRNPPGDLPV